MLEKDFLLGELEAKLRDAERTDYKNPIDNINLDFMDGYQSGRKQTIKEIKETIRKIC